MAYGEEEAEMKVGSGTRANCDRMTTRCKWTGIVRS
jgi:hypothetical protein